MSAWPRRLGRFLVMASVILVAVAGCGGVGNISGEVKVKGEPIKQGSISFASQGRKKVVKTGAIKDGKYSVQEVPSGEVLITVQAFAEEAPTLLAPPPGTKAAPAPKPKPKPDPKAKPEPRPHPKYADLSQTDLKYTVTTGDQEHNLDLEPAPAPAPGKPGAGKPFGK